MSGGYKALVEEASFAQCVERLGSAEGIDAALDPIIEALSLRPEGFPYVPGWEPIRVAKTDSISREGGSIPAIRAWFWIDGEMVRLLYVEEIPDQEEDESE